VNLVGLYVSLLDVQYSRLWPVISVGGYAVVALVAYVKL
jgi:hypothetical protein